MESESEQMQLTVQPLPVQVSLHAVEGLIQVIVANLAGVYTFFLPPDVARRMGEDMAVMAKTTTTGIVLPKKPGLVVAQPVPTGPLTETK